MSQVVVFISHLGKCKNLRLYKVVSINFCDYDFVFDKKLSLGYHCRKLREAWRLVFSSALPSKGDSEP